MKILTLSLLFATSALAQMPDTPFSDLCRRLEAREIERKIEEIQAEPSRLERQRTERALEEKIIEVIEDRERLAQ